MYQHIIREELTAQGITDIDPRHIEGYMRLQYGTLGHLSREEVRIEVQICTECIRQDGIDAAEANARSFGL